MKQMKCPVSGLILPSEFIDHKRSLKKCIDSKVEDAINELSHLDKDYCLVFHAKFDSNDSSLFQITTPIATYKVPPFTTNQMVYYVSNQRGLCELLWMVPPVMKGGKAKVEFNDEGVANLRKKGVTPSLKAV